jgi:PST family polysaccharide transporter
MGIFAGLAQGLNVFWYFQGLERMRLVASVDIAGRIIATAGIFALVRRPADGWIVLALSGGVSLFSTLMMTALAHSETGFRIPTLGLALQAATRGWTMFLFRASTGLFTTANVFLLALFAPPSIVGWFAGAEKISKASWSLLWPLTRALFPRMSHLVHTRAPEARATARASLKLMLGGGIVTGLILFLFAPLLVNGLLGREYRPAVAILRILSVLPPVVALNSFLCIQYMLPMGMDAEVNKVVLGAGMLNLVLALLFAPAYGQWAVSWSVVFAETFVLFGLWRAVRRSGWPLHSPAETIGTSEA